VEQWRVEELTMQKRKKDAQKVIEKETEIFKVEEPKLKSKKK